MLTGCRNSQEVELLKQQNSILQQQVELQKQAIQESAVTTSDYPSNNVDTSNNYNTNIPNNDNNNTNYDTPSQSACCKTCSKGKACGDSCISRSYTCHQPVGCACDW